MGMLYAICASDAIKFGVTDRSVQSRLESLQTGNARILGIAAEYETAFAYELESAIFDRLVEHRIRGEWYFPASVVLQLVEVMRSGDLHYYLSQAPELEDERPANWRAMVRTAEKRRVYMKAYMRDYREKGG